MSITVAQSKQVKTFVSRFCRRRLGDSAEVLREARQLSAEIGPRSFRTELQSRRIYQILNRQLIDLLAKRIPQLAPRRAVEIGAGEGWLSFHLNQRLKQAGEPLRLVPTDRSPCLRGVLGRPAQDALRYYWPDLVLVSWPLVDRPGEGSIDELALNFPSVEHILWIGDEPDMVCCTGSSTVQLILAEGAERFRVSDLEREGKGWKGRWLKKRKFENTMMLSSICFQRGYPRTYAFLISKK